VGDFTFAHTKTNITMSTQTIAQRLDTIYKGEPWFGESLQIKLKNISEENAFKQPVNNKHSIAEILSHMDYWHKRFALEVQGKALEEFSETGNWPDVTTLKKLGWKKLQDSFGETQHELVSLLKKANGKSIPEELLSNLNGMVDHDVYHLGQIGIVKSLVNK
jgi:uncharacterized damage-inducible protein DinB